MPFQAIAKLLISCTKAVGLFKLIRGFYGFIKRRAFRDLEGYTSKNLKRMGEETRLITVRSVVIMANSEDKDVLFQNCSVRQILITAAVHLKH